MDLRILRRSATGSVADNRGVVVGAAEAWARARLELLGERLLQSRRFLVGSFSELRKRADERELSVPVQAVLLRLRVNDEGISHLPPL